MNDLARLEDDQFVEVDPTGRYGRYHEILGKGSSKTVYKAFDEYEGIEVAWNQVKLHDFMQSPEDLERLYCEIHLLKTLKHENIMKFYTSWVDINNRNINFVTEMFTSGTLRQYRLKHRRVNIRAVKHWCRQILKGLLYLHSLDPPVIHRDLKCDNIFINGNQGEVKIGDLGLAAILKKSRAVRVVGTPEFMAPEVYEEEYNELVDIYSFGMCVLEMVTFEYPYSECTHPAQIYKKVISGKKPEALYKIKDPEIRQFVEKCLATVSSRLSARELLSDPFLQDDDYGYELRPLENEMYVYNGSLINEFGHYIGYNPESELRYHELQSNEIDLFMCQDEENMENVEIAINGCRREDDGIFLRLRIADEEGQIRNIYFPFDIENDTALSVATEMVAELDITDQDVFKIADMIDGEIARLVPEWKRGPGSEIPQCNHVTCVSCAASSHNYINNYVLPNNANMKNLQELQCSKHGCTNIHGRFEEITYQVEGTAQCENDVPNNSNHIKSTDIRAQRDITPEHSSQGSFWFNGEGKPKEQEKRIITKESLHESCNARHSQSSYPSTVGCVSWDDYENEIRQELRWLKANYQMQLRELKDQQLLRVDSKPSSSHSSIDTNVSPRSLFPKGKREDTKGALKSLHFASHTVQAREPINGSCGPEQMMRTAKKFYSGSLLLRAASLPVDAVDV